MLFSGYQSKLRETQQTRLYGISNVICRGKGARTSQRRFHIWQHDVLPQAFIVVAAGGVCNL